VIEFMVKSGWSHGEQPDPALIQSLTFSKPVGFTCACSKLPTLITNRARSALFSAANMRFGST
jgi:hypothetical protein